jgi:hypothetical protein
MKPDFEYRPECADCADHIVATALRRGLGTRPGMRRLAAVLWSGFIGAVCFIIALSLAPDEWGFPELTYRLVAIFFGLSWLLCLIPAFAASVLAGPAALGEDRAR